MYDPLRIPQNASAAAPIDTMSRPWQLGESGPQRKAMNWPLVCGILAIAGCGIVPPGNTQEAPDAQTAELIDLPAGLGSDSVSDDGSQSGPDQDADGLTLAEEFFFGTSDLLPDSDFDGLSDIDEVFVFATDPTSGDTDADGLGDYEEVHVYGTLPTAGDSDFDGLSDFQEVRIYGTDPRSLDSDSDGILDGNEVRRGTDPLNEDTDGDGISDYDEWIGLTDSLDPNDPAPPIVPGDLFSFLTQEQADILRLMQAAGVNRAAQENAICRAQVQADCASRGTCGGGAAQAALCWCHRPAWELSITEFEDALHSLLDQVNYSLTSTDRKEVSDYMHESFDLTNPCWLASGGVASCTWVSSDCAW